MKRIIVFIFILLTSLFVLTGCNNKELNSLPNLKGKKIGQIEKIFTRAGLKEKLEIQEFYLEGFVDQSFLKYGDKLKAGDPIPDKITVFVSVNKITLKDFTGKTLTEIKTQLKASNVLKYFEFKPTAGTGDNVLEGFLGYEDFEIGERVPLGADFKIKLLYDLRIKLPDLTGLNELELTNKLNELDFSDVKFKNELDNTKEMGLFAGYLEQEAGDLYNPSDEITIKIYLNDDVNTNDQINAPEQLFFSKYIDSTDNDQAIELYNPLDQTIDLKEYYLAIMSNGAFRPTKTIALTGKLAAKSTFVIASESGTDAFKAKAQMVSPDLNLNGDDVIQLRKTSNNTYIDTIYNLGNLSFIMDEEVYIRRPEYTHGNRHYNYDEWAGFVKEYKEIVGNYPIDIPNRPTFQLDTTKTFMEGGMTKIKVGTGNYEVCDGDTVRIKSDDPRDTEDYWGDGRIRFLMVDTPETYKPPKDGKPEQPGEPYAQAATNFTKNMMAKAVEIYLQADPKMGYKDTYGRHLGLIWLNINTIDEPEWILLNLELLYNGLAEPKNDKTTGYEELLIWNNRYTYQWIKEADRYARVNKLGLRSGNNNVK